MNKCTWNMSSRTPWLLGLVQDLFSRLWSWCGPRDPWCACGWRRGKVQGRYPDPHLSYGTATCAIPSVLAHYHYYIKWPSKGSHVLVSKPCIQANSHYYLCTSIARILLTQKLHIVLLSRGTLACLQFYAPSSGHPHMWVGMQYSFPLSLWVTLGGQSGMFAKPPWRYSLDLRIFNITEDRKTKLQIFYPSIKLIFFPWSLTT